MCASRQDAQNWGEMFYSARHGGWIYPADHRKPSKLLRDKWQAPFVWPYCPFCGGSLPDTESIIEKILRPPPEDQEDGC